MLRMVDIAGAGSTGGATPRGPGERDPRLERAARDFEAFVIGRLLESAFATQRGLLAAPGAAAGPFDGLLYQALGRGIAQAGGLGIADSLLAALVRAREVG